MPGGDADVEFLDDGGQRRTELQLGEIADEGDKGQNDQRNERGSAQMPVHVCVRGIERLADFVADFVADSFASNSLVRRRVPACQGLSPVIVSPAQYLTCFASSSSRRVAPLPGVAYLCFLIALELSMIVMPAHNDSERLPKPYARATAHWKLWRNAVIRPLPGASRLPARVNGIEPVIPRYRSLDRFDSAH